MKSTNIVTLLALTAATAIAQTTKPATTTPVVHHTGTTSAPHSACAKLPELSPKIPPLAADLPCAKHLYTITTTPAVKLDYVSPLAGPEIRHTLGLEPNSFSLDYVDTKIGSGPLAAGYKYYKIHYTGYLVDGTKFDSSLDRKEPITIAYGEHNVIPGWDTGFGGMRVGGKRRLFIPFELAYGAQPHGPIPARSELIFDVELVDATNTPPPPPPQPVVRSAPPQAKPAAPPQPATPATEPAKPATAPPAAQPAAQPATLPAATTPPPPKP